MTVKAGFERVLPLFIAFALAFTCLQVNREVASAARLPRLEKHTEGIPYQVTDTGSIGNFVWNDNDKDGIQDLFERGIAGIQVDLYLDTDGDGQIDPDDPLVSTTQTNVLGIYIFSDLSAGNYIVDVAEHDPDLPADGYGNPYILTTGNDPLAVALADGETYLSADFGFSAGGIVGDTIWEDLDGGGTQNAGETGNTGVQVSLYIDENSDRIYTPGVDILYGSQSTAASGYYAFTGLPRGDYVVVVTPPQGLTLTGDPDENPPCTICDHQSGFSLSPGEENLSRDFGYQPNGVLGDRVWLDLDGDGVQDGDEVGIESVQVDLTLQGGQRASTLTNSEGYYSFSNVPAGTHVVSVARATLPPRMLGTYDYDGGEDSSSRVTLTIGGVNLDIDFGFRFNGSRRLGGTAYHDDNGNGIDNEGHPGGSGYYPGVRVTLRSQNGRLLGYRTTNATGDYLFINLISGDYSVSVDPLAPILTGLQPTSPTVRNVTINLSHLLYEDFGFISISDMGDLPDSYATTLGVDGARHTVGSIYLGTALPDTDPNGQPGATATGDNNDGNNDEDGVLRELAFHWEPGATVDIQVTVGGSSGFLAAWFDWDNNGTFEIDELVDYGVLAVGMHTLQVGVSNDGSYATGDPLNARFRLFEGDPVTPAPKGYAVGGEVEDYHWVFSPTAVKITSLSARSKSNMGLSLVTLGGLAILGIAGIILLPAISADGRRTRRVHSDPPPGR